jgi:hypothetical protein
MSPTVNRVLRVVSYAGLALSLVPGVLVLMDELSLTAYYRWMVVGMLLWFGTAPLWIQPDHQQH